MTESAMRVHVGEITLPMMVMVIVVINLILIKSVVGVARIVVMFKIRSGLVAEMVVEMVVDMVVNVVVALSWRVLGLMLMVTVIMMVVTMGMDMSDRLMMVRVKLAPLASPQRSAEPLEKQACSDSYHDGARY